MSLRKHQNNISAAKKYEEKMMTTEQLIKEKARELGSNVYIAPEIAEKKLNNAVLSIAKGIDPSVVLAIVDTTILNSAKEGLVLTGDSIYQKEMLSDASSCMYSEIKEAKYSKEEVKKDNGKVEIKELVSVVNNDDHEIIKFTSSLYRLENLCALLNSIVKNSDANGVFKTSNQNMALVDMEMGIRIAYVKIVCNIAFVDDQIIDPKEYSEITSLIVRNEIDNEGRFTLRSYVTDISLIENDDSLLEYLKQKTPEGSFDLLRKSLFKDLLYIFKLKNSLLDWKQSAYLNSIKEKLEVSDEQVLLMVDAIKNDEDILNNRKNDTEIVKTMKDLVSKASAVGVPLAAIYFSGSVIGMSAAGLTSGLAALGFGGVLGFSSMVTGIGVAVLLGVGTYQGIKHLTGISDLENNKQREILIQAIVKNSQKTINFLIQDVNFIALRLSEEISRADRTDELIDKLKRQLVLMAQSAEFADQKMEFATKESVIAKLPRVLDKMRFEELTNTPTKEKLRSFVYHGYIEKIEKTDDGKEKRILQLVYDLSEEDLSRIYKILDTIGYYNIKDAALASITGIGKSLLGKIGEQS